MDIGKVPENVLKRTVLSKMNIKRDEVLLGPGVGEDCAALNLSDDEIFVMSTDPITGTAKDVGKLSIIITTNDLATSGAEPIGVMATILLPPRTREAKLKTIIDQMAEAAAEAGVDILGGHTEVTAAVNVPLVSITGVAKVKKGNLLETSAVKPGMDLVLTKWIGLEGTTIIAKEKEEELKAHFPDKYIDRAMGYDQYLSIVPEAKIAVKEGAVAMHDVTEGGIFGALWEIAAASNVGVDVDIRKIPIKQETVELCEYFKINPYELISSGALLVAISDGKSLVNSLKEAGIHAVVIGKATDSNDKIIRRDDEIRHLGEPKTDELYKVIK